MTLHSFREELARLENSDTENWDLGNIFGIESLVLLKTNKVGPQSGEGRLQ